MCSLQKVNRNRDGGGGGGGAVSEMEKHPEHLWRRCQETAFDGGDGPGAIVLSAPPGRAGGGRK